MKITHLLIAITFFVIIASPQHSLEAKEPPPITMKSTESEVIITAKEMTDQFRELLFEMSHYFLDEYSNVTNEQTLKKIFNLCNVLDTTVKNGWKSAKITQLKRDGKIIINNKNLTSLTEAEKRIVESIRDGSFMELRYEDGEYVVGVSLLDVSETNQGTLLACVKCHNSILNDRVKNKSKRILAFETEDIMTYKAEEIEIEFNDVEGVVIFRFTVSS